MGLFRQFINWADSVGHRDCLVGGEATLNAFRNWVVHVEERFRRHEIRSMTAHRLQTEIRRILQLLVENNDFGL